MKKNEVISWVDVVERIIKIFRPKAYNTIAKAVVFAGLALIAESQVNYIQALVIAIYEKIFGPSEILRSILTAADTPILGMCLIIAGMIYHLVVTLGKDYIDTKKAEVPKVPNLALSLSTFKGNRSEKELHLDGPSIVLPAKDQIPKYEDSSSGVSPYLNPALQKLSRTNSMFMGREAKPNTWLYSNRVNYLNDWGAFELLKIHLTNAEIIAKGVRVHISIPKSDNLLIKEQVMRLPTKPQKLIDGGGILVNQFDRVPNFGSSVIRFSDNENSFDIHWDVQALQAGVVSERSFPFVIKLNEPVDISYTIFCDELPKPHSSIFKLMPAQDKVTIAIDDIIDDESFEQLCAQYIVHVEQKKT